MSRLVSIVCVVFFAMSSIAQDRASYKFFCPDNNYKPFGYFIGLGLNTSIAKTHDSQLALQVSETTDYTVDVSSKGAIGKSIEFGMEHITKRGPFRIIEVGIGYRNFRGIETVQAHRTPGSDLSYPGDIITEGHFNYSRISIRVSAQMMALLGPRSYFHHGPGLFIDKSLGLRQDYDLPHLDLETRAPRQVTVPSINYMAGIGLKVGPGRFLDFYAQTPLVLFGGAKDGSSEVIYSSNYRNIIVGVRFFWMKATPDRICPAMDRPTSGRFSRKKASSQYKPW